MVLIPGLGVAADRAGDHEARGAAEAMLRAINESEKER